MQVNGILKRGISYGRYKLSFAFNQDDRFLLPCPIPPFLGVGLLHENKSVSFNLTTSKRLT